MPLMIGSWGKQTIGWAGTVADEVKVGGTANPDLVPLVREWLGAGSRTRIVVGCVSVVDDDGEWARERARAAVGPYLEVVARHDPTLELGPGEEPPLERFAIAGTPEEVAARVHELWRAGADRVELGTPQGRTTPAGSTSSASVSCRCSANDVVLAPDQDDSRIAAGNSELSGEGERHTK